MLKVRLNRNQTYSAGSHCMYSPNWKELQQTEAYLLGSKWSFLGRYCLLRLNHLLKRLDKILARQLSRKSLLYTTCSGRWANLHSLSCSLTISVSLRKMFVVRRRKRIILRVHWVVKKSPSVNGIIDAYSSTKAGVSIFFINKFITHFKAISDPERRFILYDIEAEPKNY